VYAFRKLHRLSSTQPPFFNQLFTRSLLNITTHMGTMSQQFVTSVAEDDNMDIDIDIDMDADVEPIPEPELEVMLSRSSHSDCARFSHLSHRMEKNMRRLRSTHQYRILLYQPSILRTQNKRFSLRKFTSEASMTSRLAMCATSQLHTF
jgi:hypothetical protein